MPVFSILCLLFIYICTTLFVFIFSYFVLFCFCFPLTFAFFLNFIHLIHSITTNINVFPNHIIMLLFTYSREYTRTHLEDYNSAKDVNIFFFSSQITSSTPLEIFFRLKELKIAPQKTPLSPQDLPTLFCQTPIH